MLNPGMKRRVLLLQTGLLIPLLQVRALWDCWPRRLPSRIRQSMVLRSKNVKG